ncbi:MAG: MBL fold metallo-hydrolase [Ktedonobacterales bacterium]|nr:MBL fold metallo-hydrolase [Ktedonobacterales bacterium]
MEIWSLGHSGFRLRGKEVTLVLDPPAAGYGSSLKGISADIVCITHDHPGHNNVAGLGGTPYVVHGPGEYEVGGVLITGMRTFHDTKHGEERGSNTIYIIHMEELLLCHLGDLGHGLNADQQQEASGADVLMIPVGGHSTIDAKAAAELVGAIEPGFVIPMHYANSANTKGNVPLDPVEPFGAALGVPLTEPQTKLVVTRATVPASPQIVILTARG